MTESPKQKVERNVSLDMVRIFAILAVLMIHASAPFVRDFDSHSIEYFWGNVFDSLAKVANPLFVMVSGALLLDERRNLTISSLFRKNIRGILTLIIIWGIVYAGVYRIIIPVATGEDASVKAFVLALRGHWHMWFLYMLLGLYLATPFLRSFTKRGEQRLALLYIVIALCTAFLRPVVSALAVFVPGIALVNELINDHLYVYFFFGYTAFYVAGWLLTQYPLGKKARIALWMAGIVSAATIIVFTWLTKDQSLYDNIGIPVFLTSTAAFTALMTIRTNFSDRMKKIIVALSKLSFGVYIIHPLFLTLFDALVPYQHTPPLYIACYFTALAIVSWTATFLLSKIPILKIAVRM